jgi:hypothetical protein
MDGYAVVFISHSKDKTFKPKNGNEYNQIVPSCSTAYNEIIKNMADIMGYIDVNGSERKLVLRSPDGSIDCKCRFKHIAPVIDFSYQSLVNALNDAIDKEAAETGNKFVTNERAAVAATVEYDYEALMTEFSTIAGDLMNKNQTKYGPLITQIIDRILGRGKKISDTTPDQAEFVYLILQEVKEIQ